MSPRGRGRHYSPARGVVESALRRLYVGDWPARLWSRWPGATRVRRVHHRLRLLPAGTPPLRVVLLSDLHVGPTTPPATLAAAAALARDARPDVLLVGGDLVFLDATPARCAALTDLLAGVEAPVKVAVWGNHDLWTDHDALQVALEAAGVELRVNAGAPLPAPWSTVGLVGLDEPWTGAPDADAALAAVSHLDCVLALAHSPDGLPHLVDRVDLLCCGHTHGGQVALPGGRPLVVPGPLGPAYPHGLHRVGRTWLMVSRGVGGVEVPVRLFAPPDVVVLDLAAR